MITLAPISEKIQDTLNKKIAMLKSGAGGNQIYKNGEGKWEAGKTAIGTTVSENGSTVENYMFSRSPWLRMISFTPKNFKEMKEKDPLEAVIIMGGELSTFGKLRSGFNSTKSIINEPNASSGLYNPNGKIPYRPIAGIKDISIDYKGGGMRLGATRTATINWTCWTWEDHERLEQHFLKDGKSVLLEWGWTGIGDLKEKMFMDNIFDPDKPVPTFSPDLGLKNEKDKLKQTLNQKILKHIQEKGGHYDAMFGLITSFTWSVRDDGGFDCVTTLIAPGVTMLQKTVQKTSRAETFSRLPLISTSMHIGEEPIKGVNAGSDAANEAEKDEDTGKVHDIGSSQMGGKYPEGTVLAWGEFWFSKREHEYKLKKEAAEGVHLEVIKEMTVKGIAHYITFREYMSDFPSQLKKSALEAEQSGTQEIFFAGKFPEKQYKIEPDGKEVVAVTDEDGNPVMGDNKVVVTKLVPKFKMCKETDDKTKKLGSTKNGGEIFVSWGWFEDNVLSRFFGTISGENESAHVIGEFRSMEQAIDDNGNPRKTDNGILIMQATRFTNAQWVITLDSSKWIIVGGEDPIATHSNGWWAKPVVVRADIKGGPIVLKDYFYMKDGIKDNDPENINKNTKDHLVIRNVLFNARYLKEKFEDKEDLLSTVTSVWNDFSSAYGGVYNFKVDYDDGGHRLLLKEQGYSNFKVQKLIEKKKEYEAGNISESSLFVFPIWEAGSIVKSNSLTAKLPTRMKLAAMYSTNRTLGKQKKIDNPWDDFIADAWGHLKTPPEDLKSESGRTAAQEKHKIDLVSGDMNFPSRGNRRFGRKDADVQQSLVIGDGEGKNKAGTIIHDSILNIIAESSKEELQRRKRMLIENKPMSEEEYEEYLAEGGDAQRDWLQRVFKSYTEEGVSGFLGTDQLLSLYEWEEFDEVETTDGEGTDQSEDSKQKTGYLKIKYEMLYNIQTDLREGVDGIFQKVEPLIPIDFEMEIDGTGGLYPGNSFHSSYLSETYKDRCLFQMVKIGHRIDSSGWKTTIKGQIRAVPIENKSGVSLTLGTSGNETTKNNQSGEESNNPTGAGISQEDPYTNMNSEQANNLAKNNGKTSFYWQTPNGNVINWTTWP